MQVNVATMPADLSSAALATPPTSPGFKHPSVGIPARPTTAAMRQHNRSSSRMAESSRSSEDESTRTAVKVAVRVRPSLKPTDPGFDLIPQRFREKTCEVSSSTNLSVQSPQGKKLFVFDRVFDEQTTQEGIWDYLSDSVSSFVKGYNVSILAYGQSGAGKSYTMGTSGPEDQNDADVKGIVPRAAQALFEKLTGPSAPTTTSRQSGLQTPKRYSMGNLAQMTRVMNGVQRNWELRATYVEIYNEQLRDLLLPDTTPHGERPQVVIREDTKGRIMLTGLTQMPINSADDVLNALNFGSSIRQTDATAINARSSRSHAVFSLNLIQKKSEPTKENRSSLPSLDGLSGTESVVTIDSKLHFVDLAGSERLKNTGATGDRAREGISINAGLASLGKVISQLSSKHASAHISYRDSRLTRLLQDSLGGNAITFMVACVTPAVFHLSETLNTVHYAQRARAIQSKPEIQESHEDGDKQAAIDRLRAEVSFLRDQIRHTSEQPGGRSVGEKNERSDRIRGRDTELQSQLLDMQENYNALSQRHAKLIAEISRARDDGPADTPLLDQAIGENASERIRRSNSFAEAVEQVVLEYEKTIQTLEGSLSKTRANLSSTESSLLEKETRMAYMDTIQHQLQARIQKYMDREQNNESYTRDLERKMEGASSEDERKDTLITELRKELERARESESGAEDYISTLEERLAEAEQDQEIMQREIDRLEHVVERQRSIGRLDNLLGELDGVRSFEPQTNGAAAHPVQPTATTPAAAQTNGHRDSYDPFRPDSDADIPEGSSVYDDDEYQTPGGGEEEKPSSISPPSVTGDPHSPAQNVYMADKLENLTQEFFDLRSEHESVLVDYDNLQQKYRTALETLAKLEYEKGVPKSPESANGSRPESFLADAGVKGEEKVPAGQPSSSRSSSELSSPEQSTSGVEIETSEEIDDTVDPAQVPLPEDHEGMVQELESLRKMHAESEDSVAALTKNYMNLAQRHESTLSQLEDLKQEVQRSQQFRPSSPSPVSPGNLSKSLWRRKSNDVLGEASDRSSRSIVSLKTIAMDHFEQNPDVRQSFDLNLTTVMTELHNRSERIQVLEAELTNVRREMEQKQTIISGLTRERTSLAAASTAVDFSVVGKIQEQLAESENQIRTLHEQHAEKERAFEDQLEDLKSTIAEHQKMNATLMSQINQLPTPSEDRALPGGFPVTPSSEFGLSLGGNDEIVRLQHEVAAWERKHTTAMDKMNSSQADLLTTIAALQESLRAAEGRSRGNSPMPSPAVGAGAIYDERAQHEKTVSSLEREVQEHRVLADTHAAKVREMQSAYDEMQQRFDEDSSARALTEKELRTQRDLVANLENQLQVHKSAITIHQESLESLQSSHTQEMENLRASMSNSDRDAAEKTGELQSQLNAAQSQMAGLLRGASSALGYETDASKLHSQIKGLVEEGKEVHTRHLKTTNELKSVQEELQRALTSTALLEEQLEELKNTHETSSTKLDKMTDKYNKSSRLVEELEEQLNSNFDSHQATNNRLSTMQMESVQARMELEKELEEAKLRNRMLEQQVSTLQRESVASNASLQNRDSLSPEAAAIALARSASGSSNPRKSNAPTSLPTPPPSIPLPPLPSSPISATTPITNGIDAKTIGTPRTTSPVPATSQSPPGSRHASHEQNNNHNGPNVAQVVEEQEARIRTIEKHLFAEKQLTATLEEALVDLENSANRTKSEMESWRKKCGSLEEEMIGLRREHSNSRASLQAVEEEREMRVRAERARQALEQRMAELNNKKKKKSALNCF